MKRTILALAIAGLSVTAYALPPPGGGPPTPLDVHVTNPVVPVEVSNAEPIPVVVTSQPSSGTYYYRMTATCPFTNQCIAEFPQVPAGKQLVVTNITMVATIQSAGDGVFSIRPSSTSQPWVAYPVTSFSGAYYGTTFSSNNDVEVVFGPGSIPVLEFGRGVDIYGSTVSFGMTGYITDESP